MSDAAFVLGSTLASLGLNESTIKRLLAERLAQSKEERGLSVQSVRQGSSDRGMLYSSASMNDQATENLKFDRADSSAQSNTNDQLSRIAQQRLDAEAAYKQQVAEEQAKIAAEQEAIKPGFDPADPFNWKGIAAEQAAQGTSPAFVPPVPGGTPEDPYNWKGIAAEQQAQGTRAPNSYGTSSNRVPTKPATPKPKPVVNPPRAVGGKVIRF